jgi:hypothetical protein
MQVRWVHYTALRRPDAERPRTRRPDRYRGFKNAQTEEETQIRSRLEFRFIFMKQTLSFFALGALLLTPFAGHADDSIAGKAEEVIHGIRQGIKDAAHDVRQAVVGRDVEVSLGERHMEMPTSVEAGDVTFTVTNMGSEDRGFKISGPGLERSFTAPLPPGESAKLTVNLVPGVYLVEAPAESDPTKHLTVEFTALAK